MSWKKIQIQLVPGAVVLRGRQLSWCEGLRRLQGVGGRAFFVRDLSGRPQLLLDSGIGREVGDRVTELAGHFVERIPGPIMIGFIIPTIILPLMIGYVLL